MILEIKKYPDPILRKKSEEVKEITQEIKNLGQNMIETMVKGQGIGLAAPQVGELKRIITVKTQKGPEIFINPKITKKSRETEILEEGCLSFPGLFLKIKRVKGVEVESLDIEGRKLHIKVIGVLAQAFQHEIDHLDGVLFIDRLSLVQRWKIKKKIAP